MATLSPTTVARRRALMASLEAHGLKVGLIHAALLVKIICTDNTYVKSGTVGVLMIHETDIFGAVNVATFRELRKDGSLNAPVEVRSVVFQNERTIY